MTDERIRAVCRVRPAPSGKAAYELEQIAVDRDAGTVGVRDKTFSFDGALG